jgi:hypothetical protein
MIAGRQPFSLRLDETGSLNNLGHIGPFLPVYGRNPTPQDQSYPDAFRLPRLPLPLLLRVARFTRKFSPLRLVPTPIYYITGTTKDLNSAVIAGAVVELYETVSEKFVGKTTSDALGNYTIPASPSVNQFAVGYKVGSPDIAGTTVNTLRGQ